MKKLSTIQIILLVAIIVLSAAANAEDTIKIGTLYPFTGPLAYLGSEAWIGLKIITDKVNNEGGVLGKKVELIKGDAATQDSAISECERLIVIEKCKAIMGTISSARSMVGTAVAERHRIPYFEDTGISNRITERGFKYLFRIAPLASDIGVVGARYIANEICPKLNIKPQDLKVAIIYESGELGTMISKNFAEESKKLEMQMVMNESFKGFSRDMSDIVLRLKSANVDALFLAGYSPDFATFWRQARELDFNPKAIFSNEAFDIMLSKTFADQINGVFNVYAPIRGINVKGLRPEAAKAYEYFFKTFKKDYPNAVFHATELLSYLSGQLLFEHILPKAGSLEAEAIRKTALSLDIPEGGTVLGYGVKFAPPGHPMAGQNLMAYIGVLQWQEKDIYTVWPEEFAAKKPILVPLPRWKEREK
jgi:branched-chain amino acid transport system substrate-binding protein